MASKPKYQDGSTVIYKESLLTVIDSYRKDYGNPGWFYNLNYPDLQAIPEHQLTPFN